MDTLAGYGSDSSSSSSSSGGGVAPTSAATALPVEDATPPPPAKKKGRWDDAPTKKGVGSSNTTISGTAGGNALPKPHLSTNKSMIEWEIDLLSNYPSSSSLLPRPPQGGEREAKQQLLLTEESREFLEDTLLKQQPERQRLHGSAEVALGKQLKQQHDFHNPRFFENTAASCGITNLLGTNIGGEETFEEYEFNLLQLEEEARTQIYTQIQQEHERNQQFERQEESAAAANSQFATSQLERALQQQCNR